MTSYASGKGGTAKPVTGSGKGAISAENQRQRDWMLAMQQKYPSATESVTVPDANGGNSRKTIPGEYAYPTAERERFLLKQELKRDGALAGFADKSQQQLVWTPSESDINVMMDLEKARRTFEYHTWIESLMDIKQPGNLRWLQENAPDFLQYKMNALKTSLKLIEQEAKINALGIQSEEDLQFAFMKSQDMLRDGRDMTPQNRYVKGFFNPGYNIPGKPGPWTDILAGTPAEPKDRIAGRPWRAADAKTEWGGWNVGGKKDRQGRAPSGSAGVLPGWFGNNYEAPAAVAAPPPAGGTSGVVP